LVLAARLVVVLVAVALLGAACGADTPTAGESKESHEAQLAQLRAQTIARIPGASDLQREILSDLYVSPAEADRAAADVIDCMAQQGYETTAKWDSVDSTMQFTTRNKNGPQQTRVVMDQCWNERFGVVGEMLAAQGALSFEQTQALERRMIACLAESGIEVDQWPTDIAQGDLSVESDCYDRSVSGL